MEGLTEDIGVDEEYIQSVREAYESGALVAGSPKAGGIAGQARYEDPALE